jgi:hypothetical protein
VSAAIAVTVLVLFWGLVVVRLPTLLRDARQRAIWSACCALALCKTAAVPAVNLALHRFVDQPRILPHLFGVAAACFLLRLMFLVADRRAAAWHQFLVGVAVGAALWTFAALAPEGVEADPTQLMAGAISPPAMAYWLLLEAYLGVILATATVLFFSLGRRATGPLRYGLWCFAAGALLVALFAVMKAGLIGAHALGADVPEEVLGPVTETLRDLGFVLIPVGALVPAYERTRSTVRSYRSLRALHPLWDLMRRTFPEIILFTPRRALIELAGVEDVDLRLYRRVIEIRDGMLALRDFLPPDALAEALDRVKEPAVAEACGIELALHRRRHDLPTYGGASRWTGVGTEMADEVGWLRDVSAALHRPEPAAFVTWWVRHHPEPIPA